MGTGPRAQAMALSGTGCPMSTAAAIRRHTPAYPCAVCRGHSRLPRHRGARDYGFTTADGYVHCTRPEYAGQLRETDAGTFAHRLEGPCKCGNEHGLIPVPPPSPKPVLDVDRVAAARRIWERARPISGTLAETYLRGRALTLHLPPTLRYATLKHPSCGESPCMVAAVTVWPSKELRAVHRTFLAHDGRGKAQVEPNKMALGPIRGGAVRLAPLGETLAVAEGVETALSILQETGIPTWAALSTSGMRSLVVPETVREIIIAADADQAGISAAISAADRWTAQGRRVRITKTPPGCDMNDLLRKAS